VTFTSTTAYADEFGEDWDEDGAGEEWDDSWNDEWNEEWENAQNAASSSSAGSGSGSLGAADAALAASGDSDMEAILSAPRTNIRENTKGIGSDPLFSLDNDAAKTFEQMTNMERENAVMKLQIEQEKLRLDLRRQFVEKKKIELALEDEESNRTLRRSENVRRQREAERRASEEEEDLKRRTEQKRQEEELNRRILASVEGADLSNPEQLAAVKQLMSMSSGGVPSNLNALMGAPGGGPSISGSQAPSKDFDSKYVIKSIVGAGGNMTANVENVENRQIFRVRVGTVLDGWKVESVTRTSILLKNGEQEKIMNLNQ